MAFFEELGRKAKDVAAVAADKAKDMAAVAADKARETTVRSLTASSVPSAALPWINAYTENQGRPMGGLGFYTESRNSLKC